MNHVSLAVRRRLYWFKSQINNMLNPNNLLQGAAEANTAHLKSVVARSPSAADCRWAHVRLGVLYLSREFTLRDIQLLQINFGRAGRVV